MRVQVPPSAQRTQQQRTVLQAPSFFFGTMRHKQLRAPKHLSKKEWYCVIVASFYAAGKRSRALPHLKRALTTDRIPDRLFSELFLHLSLVLGYPTMLDGLSHLREMSGVASKQPTASLCEEKLLSRGTKSLSRIYGNTTPRLLSNMALLHVDLPRIVLRDVYGRMMSRPGLNLREREIVNVIVLSLQGLDQQLYSHVRGALRVGVTAKMLKEVIAIASRCAGRKLPTPLRYLAERTEN